MPSIDERVVSMSFENAKFEAGVAQTMATLAKLNDTLAKVGGASGFSKIEAEAGKVTLSGPMSAVEKLKAKLSEISGGRVFSDLEGASDRVHFSGITGALEKIKSRLGFPEAKSAFAELSAADDKVSFAEANAEIEKTASHFSIIQGAAAVAFGSIAAQATMGMSKAVTSALGALKDGFADYELKIGSTQTIMAGTGEDIKTVTGYLKELDEYADRTIYNLRDMTGNIGKFTNAGVDLETAVNAMKGISNEAALSGANANEAARSMYNLGQAIGSGVVRLQDWRSVDLANMGTKEFKEQLIDAALALGTLKKGNDGTIRSLKGNEVNYKTFNSTLADQWLTAEALTKTLSKYSDENTALGKRAYAAASDVKTVTMMITTLAAAAGTSWTDTFDIIIGNLPEATKLWTNVTNAIGGFIGRSGDARNAVLQGWKDLGGRTKLIDGLRELLQNLFGWLRQIGLAFRDIFPRKTAEDLMSITETFRDFAYRLDTTDEFADKLRRTFAGFFAVLDIGWEIVKQVIGVIFDLFGVVGDGAGGFLNVTAAIGDWLVALDKGIAKGGALNGIFDSLSTVLQVPLELFKELATALVSMFTGDAPAKAEGVATAMSKLDRALRPLRGVLDDVHAGWEKLQDIFGKVREVVEPGLTKVLEFIGGFGQMVTEKFENIDWDRALAAIQAGLIGGLLLKLKNGLAGIFQIDIGGSVIKNLNDGLAALTTNLKAMQRSIQVATLLEIAAAILLLAGGVFILSQIPADKLEKAMTAVAVGLAQLVGAMALLSKVMGGGKLAFIQMPIIAGAMVLLATSVVILAAAMKIMATMSWEELAKGLGGVAGALVAVGAATQFMNGPKLLVTAAALLPLAIGLNILAVAVKIFASMGWEEMARGLVGVAGALGVIVLAMSVMPPNMVVTGAGLILIATGLNILSVAVAMFGSMDLKTVVQGLLAVGFAIMGIAGAMMLMPPNIIATAAGLILVSIALNGIATAVGLLGTMDVATLVKGLVAMGGALLILAGGLYLMTATLGGSAALLAAAAAFAILGPAIAFMGQLKITTILKGLGAMALILTVLAVAGTLAAGPITALGLALAAMGAGMLVVSAALSLFVLALAELGDHGPKAIAAAAAAFAAFLLVLPKLIIDFLKGIVVVVAEIVKIAPMIAESFVKIATTLLTALISLSPKIAEAIGALVVLIAQVLSENVPVLAAAGLAMLVGLLTSVQNNLPKVMALATNIVVSFITGLGNGAPRIVKAGADTLIKFLNGVDSKIPRIVATVGKMIVTFLDSVTGQIPKVVKSGINMITKFLTQIANAVPKFIGVGVKIIVGFLQGIQDAIPKVAKKALSVARTLMNTLADTLVGLVDIGFRAIIRFLHGIANSIRTNRRDLFEAGLDIAKAIVEGIVEGLGWVAQKVIRPIIDKLFSWLPDKIKGILGIHSPSRVFALIGEQTMMGFVVGVQDTQPAMARSMESAADTVIDAAKSSFGNMPSLLEGVMDTNPVITPVLDLSQVERDAQKLGDLSNVVPITAAASFDQASAASQEVSASKQAADEAAEAAGVAFNYEQNNYSPEALSDVEIYRKTKNQLSQVKKALGLVS